MRNSYYSLFLAISLTCGISALFFYANSQLSTTRSRTVLGASSQLSPSLTGDEDITETPPAAIQRNNEPTPPTMQTGPTLPFVEIPDSVPASTPGLITEQPDTLPPIETTPEEEGELIEQEDQDDSEEPDTERNNDEDSETTENNETGEDPHGSGGYVDGIEKIQECLDSGPKYVWDDTTKECINLIIDPNKRGDDDSSSQL